jgi:hypothetical protein
MSRFARGQHGSWSGFPQSLEVNGFDNGHAT